MDSNESCLNSKSEDCLSESFEEYFSNLSSFLKFDSPENWLKNGLVSNDAAEKFANAPKNNFSDIESLEEFSEESIVSDLNVSNKTKKLEYTDRYSGLSDVGYNSKTTSNETSFFSSRLTTLSNSKINESIEINKNSEQNFNPVKNERRLTYEEFIKHLHSTRESCEKFMKIEKNDSDEEENERNKNCKNSENNYFTDINLDTQVSCETDFIYDNALYAMKNKTNDDLRSAENSKSFASDKSNTSTSFSKKSFQNTIQSSIPPAIMRHRSNKASHNVNSTDSYYTTTNTFSAISTFSEINSSNFSSETSTLSPEERLKKKRVKVIDELMRTEQTYLNHLNLIVILFLEPLQRMQLLPDHIISQIFGNLTNIIAINKELQSHLSTHTVGKSFLKLAPFLKLYSAYAQNHERALAVLMEWDVKSKGFSSFRRAQEERQEMSGLKLNALLITPVQRIPRYKLLLQDLLKCTPFEHVDHHNLKEAVRLIEGVARHIDNHILQQDNFVRLLALQKFFPQNAAPPLLKPGRLILKEGLLKKVSQKGRGLQDRVFFLFTDILMYASPRSTFDQPSINASNRHTFRKYGNFVGYQGLSSWRIFPLHHCDIQKVLGGSDASGTLFSITCKTESIIVLADQPYVEEWILAINDQIRKVRANRSTLRKRSSAQQPMRMKEGLLGYWRRGKESNIDKIVEEDEEKERDGGCMGGFINSPFKHNNKKPCNYLEVSHASYPCIDDPTKGDGIQDSENEANANEGYHEIAQYDHSEAFNAGGIPDEVTDLSAAANLTLSESFENIFDDNNNTKKNNKGSSTKKRNVIKSHIDNRHKITEINQPTVAFKKSIRKGHRDDETLKSKYNISQATIKVPRTPYRKIKLVDNAKHVHEETSVQTEASKTETCRKKINVKKSADHHKKAVNNNIIISKTSDTFQKSLEFEKDKSSHEKLRKKKKNVSNSNVKNKSHKNSAKHQKTKKPNFNESYRNVFTLKNLDNVLGAKYIEDNNKENNYDWKPQNTDLDYENDQKSAVSVTGCNNNIDDDVCHDMPFNPDEDDVRTQTKKLLDEYFPAESHIKSFNEQLDELHFESCSIKSNSSTKSLLNCDQIIENLSGNNDLQYSEKINNNHSVKKDNIVRNHLKKFEGLHNENSRSECCNVKKSDRCSSLLENSPFLLMDKKNKLSAVKRNVDTMDGDSKSSYHYHNFQSSRKHISKENKNMI